MAFQQWRGNQDPEHGVSATGTVLVASGGFSLCWYPYQNVTCRSCWGLSNVPMLADRISALAEGRIVDKWESEVGLKQAERQSRTMKANVK